MTREEILQSIFNPCKPEGWNPDPRVFFPKKPEDVKVIRVSGNPPHENFNVNFLSEEQGPLGCTILGQGDDASYRRQDDYQTHYVVRHDATGELIRFRICKAMEGSGYAAYACGWFFGEDRLNHELDAVRYFGSK